VDYKKHVKVIISKIDLPLNETGTPVVFPFSICKSLLSLQVLESKILVILNLFSLAAHLQIMFFLSSKYIKKVKLKSDHATSNFFAGFLILKVKTEVLLMI
jgi:hypothetical protein